MLGRLVGRGRDRNRARERGRKTKETENDVDRDKREDPQTGRGLFPRLAPLPVRSISVESRTRY